MGIRKSLMIPLLAGFAAGWAVVLAPRVSADGTELSEAAVRAFAGAAPERCVFASAGYRVCSWPFEGRLIGGDVSDREPLALNLICQVAIEGVEEPRCEVHPAGPAQGALPAVSAGLAPLVEARVLDRIETARSTIDLSFAMGAIPLACRSGAGDQRCDWALPPDDRTERDALLRCSLPLDGSERQPGSCMIVEQKRPEATTER